MTKVDENAFVPVLDEELLGTVTELLRSSEAVQLAYLFGSQAEGKTSALSDIDIAVLFNSDADDDAHRRLFSKLAGVLNTYEIDLVDLGGAPPLLQHHVISHGRLLLERDHAVKVRFERDAMLRYFDTAPLREALTVGLKRQLGAQRG